ncbi:hypothetical protein BD413DRAFT_477830 [Trametes elegans]|nr:hypothetical protein BD413DRAFT_477830 [Trametes elegans]
MLKFWTRSEPWLAARGYYIYPRRRDPYSGGSHWCTPEYAAPSPLPFAHCVREDETVRPTGTPPPKICWAQDSHHRDIALKLVNTGTDEYTIYQTLLQSVDPSSCAGVLAPVAIIDTPYHYSFVAMPRWGNINHPSKLETVAQVLRFMRCTLKGLSLLHAHRIAHRDIKESNILVNCYSTDINKPRMAPVLVQHGRTNDVHYCIFDFDLSIRLPPSTPLKSCWRPAVESLIGMSPYQPQDIARGVPVYNPFAFDVGTLGNMFRIIFSTAVSAVPLLAPLFDKMTTHVLSQRFTAEEALDFLDFISSQLPEGACDSDLALEPDWMCVACPDRYWSLIPPEFRSRWSHCKSPELSWFQLILDWFSSFPIGWRLLCNLRKILRI